MSNTEIFLDKYRQLEVAVRYAYKLDKYASAASFLKKHKTYKKYSTEIDFCADIRNLLSHNPKLGGEYAVQPSEKMLDFMDFLLSTVKSRKQCRDIAVKFKDISRFTLSGKVCDAIRVMEEKKHSHIPIVGNHRVIGIFDENALFSVIAGEGTSFLANNPGLKFADIQKHISLSDRGSKKYIFVPGNMYLDELDSIFDKYYAERKRVGLVFVTQSGMETEPLQGILTPWDVVANL